MTWWACLPPDPAPSVRSRNPVRDDAVESRIVARPVDTRSLRGSLVPLRDVLVALVFLGPAGWVAAHHPEPVAFPAGTGLCADAGSITVSKVSKPATPAPAPSVAAEGVSARLGHALPAILSAFGRPDALRRTCRGAGDYLRLDLEAVHLDPATYRGFGEDAYGVRGTLRVGPYEALADAGDAAAFSAAVFSLTTGHLHSVGDTGRPIDEHLFGVGRELLVETIEAYAAASPLPARAALPAPTVGVRARSTFAVGAALLIVTGGALAAGRGRMTSHRRAEGTP